MHAIAGFDFVALPLAEPVKGKSAFFVRCSAQLKEQAEAIEQLKIQVKLLEESLQAHSNVPNEIKALTKADVEFATRLDLLYKRIQSVAPIKPV